VKVRWAANACAPLAGRARLVARLDVACEVLAGTFRAKKVKRAVAARRPACGDGVIDLAGGETCDLPPVPERVTPQLDPARAATATVGAGGGTVETTAADGTVYRLDVPAGALVVDEAITLTPVVAIPDLPLRRGLVAAVEFGPDGLQLNQPATLTITLPGAPDVEGLVGFGYAGAGERPHLDFLRVVGATLTLKLTHFSALGAALAAPEDFAALVFYQLSAAVEYQVSQLLLLHQQGAPAAAYAAALREWYDFFVASEVALSIDDDPALRLALREFHEWAWRMHDIELLFGIEFDAADQASLDSRRAAGKSAVAAGLRAGVERANIRCLSLENVAGAEDALRWQAMATALGVGTTAEQLDLVTVVDGLCVEVVFIDTAYPYPATQPLVVGQPATLHLQVGWQFTNGGPVVFEQSASPAAELVLAIAPSHTVEGPVTYGATETGVFEHLYTPAGTGEVTLQVEACISLTGQPQLLVDHVCQQALIVRGLVVEPATATLVPGGTQQFTAELFGEPAEAVVWSADGGVIDATGLYTAPDEPGTYTITAVVPGLGLIATATVTVDDVKIFAQFTSLAEDGMDTPFFVVASVPGSVVTVRRVWGGTVTPPTESSPGIFFGSGQISTEWPFLVVDFDVSLPGSPVPIVVRADTGRFARVVYVGHLEASECPAGSTESLPVTFELGGGTGFSEPGVDGPAFGGFFVTDDGTSLGEASVFMEYAGSQLMGSWTGIASGVQSGVTGTMVDGHIELSAYAGVPSPPECPSGTSHFTYAGNFAVLPDP
jgi:hypothetical protein